MEDSGLSAPNMPPATSKQSPPIASAGEENLNRLQTGIDEVTASTGATEAMPPPAGALAVAPELEVPLDSLWLQLCSRRGDEEASHRTVLMTHWGPGDGGTTLAVGLALRAALLEPTRSFCLVDLDLPGRRLTHLAGLLQERGVSEVLREQCSTETAVFPTNFPNLFVMGSGRSRLAADDFSRRSRSREFAADLCDRFDSLILDLPQLRDHAAVTRWAGGLGRAVLVVRSGKTRRWEVEQALATLRNLGVEIAGVVLNAHEPVLPGWLAEGM